MAQSNENFKNNFTRILSFILLLVFFQPPIAINQYKLFLSDFVILGALLYAITQSPKPFFDPKTKKVALIGFFVFLIAFIHSIWRVSLVDEFRKYELIIKEDDQFHFVKELWNTLRFYSWFMMIAFAVRLNQFIDLKKISKVTTAIFYLIVFSLVAYKLSEDVRTLMGSIYQYDPNYFDWKGRAHGVFASPVEASMSVLILGITLLSMNVMSNEVRKNLNTTLIGILSLLSIYLTRSGTAFISIILSVSMVFLFARKNISKKTLFIWFASVIALSVFIAIEFNTIWENYPLLRGKILNLMYRLKPWYVYSESLLKRFDYLLFGYGFIPYHSDNSFLFLLSRGGLLMFGSFAWAFTLWVKSQKQNWSHWQLHLVLFLIISCFTLDVLIYRHTVVLLIALVIPYLSVQAQSVNVNAYPKNN